MGQNNPTTGKQAQQGGNQGGQHDRQTGGGSTGGRESGGQHGQTGPGNSPQHGGKDAASRPHEGCGSK